MQDLFGLINTCAGGNKEEPKTTDYHVIEARVMTAAMPIINAELASIRTVMSELSSCCDCDALIKRIKSDLANITQLRNSGYINDQTNKAKIADWLQQFRHLSRETTRQQRKLHPKKEACYKKPRARGGGPRR